MLRAFLGECSSGTLFNAVYLLDLRMSLQSTSTSPLGERLRVAFFAPPFAQKSCAFSTSDDQVGPLVRYHPDSNHLMAGISEITRNPTSKTLLLDSRPNSGLVQRMAKKPIDEITKGATK